jgi:nicotinate-nucleotide--dimethylbenzimidazole phosphoribosyltransferase
MSVDGWHKILVLGGIRSGKSEFAESLLAQAPKVRYVATAARGEQADAEWSARLDAHRDRRPQTWATEETGADPSRLAQVISEAATDETLLVDDLGGWVTVLLDPAHQPADDLATIDELAAALRGCAARVVLVSPEVGLSLVPTTPVGRAFADALGSTNQAIAAACDAVVLVVAGQPTWLKGAGAPEEAPAIPVQPVPARPGVAIPDAGGPGDLPVPPVLTPAPPELGEPAEVSEQAEAGRAAADSWTAPTMALPMVTTGLVIQPGMELPMPDEYAGPEAAERLATLDLHGSGLGNLQRAVEFAASTQGTAAPTPWRSVRVLLVHGDHAGGCAAGTLPGESARRAAQARSGDGPLARLAAQAGATLQVVEAPAAAPIEDGPALTAEAVDAALRYGWRLADEAVDSGVDAIVLAACGAGADAAAAAVLAATSGAEPVAVLARVVTAGGQVDDLAWMTRCAAVRDALRRTRQTDRGARDVLAHVGGGDVAVATGVLLGATARRTPVLLDGPVGVAAALVSRDLAGQARHWCLLPDTGSHPGVRLAAEILGLTPLVDLRLDLGEGATALATLPLLRSALSLASLLPPHGGPGDAPEPESDRDSAGEPPGRAENDDEEEFVEPEPEGPGPATTEPAEDETEPAETEPAEDETEPAGNQPEPAGNDTVPAGGDTEPNRQATPDRDDAGRSWFAPAVAPRGS